MREWTKYINKQEFSECQLVTALNAYYYLKGEPYCLPNKSPVKYRKLVELCGAMYGAAIRIDKVYKKLGLTTTKKVKHLFEYKTKKLPLPLETVVWHKRTGFHSVLIVDQCLRTGCIRIANFRHVTSNEGWMFLEDLYQYNCRLFSGNNGINNKEGKQWNFRQFKLGAKS